LSGDAPLAHTADRVSDRISYLARYFTGEAASSRSEEAVRVPDCRAHPRSFDQWRFAGLFSD
jgi:hypothetical protein